MSKDSCLLLLNYAVPYCWMNQILESVGDWITKMASFISSHVYKAKEGKNSPKDLVHLDEPKLVNKKSECVNVELNW